MSDEIKLPAGGKPPAQPIDPRLYATPLGAVAGLALIRTLVPKKRRNWKTYLAGGAGGAAAGYGVGTLMKPKPAGRATLPPPVKTGMDPSDPALQTAHQIMAHPDILERETDPERRRTIATNAYTTYLRYDEKGNIRPGIQHLMNEPQPGEVVTANVAEGMPPLEKMPGGRSLVTAATYGSGYLGAKGALKSYDTVAHTSPEGKFPERLDTARFETMTPDRLNVLGSIASAKGAGSKEMDKYMEALAQFKGQGKARWLGRGRAIAGVAGAVLPPMVLKGIRMATSTSQETAVKHWQLANLWKFRAKVADSYISRYRDDLSVEAQREAETVRSQALQKMKENQDIATSWRTYF